LHNKCRYSHALICGYLPDGYLEATTDSKAFSLELNTILMNEHILMGRGKYDLVKFQKFIYYCIPLGVKCHRVYTPTKGLSICGPYPLLRLLQPMLSKNGISETLSACNILYITRTVFDVDLEFEIRIVISYLCHVL
jgi:hypothetical protein